MTERERIPGRLLQVGCQLPGLVLLNYFIYYYFNLFQINTVVEKKVYTHNIHLYVFENNNKSIYIQNDSK